MMQVTFLGSGTSMGVPVAGGFGSEILSDDPRNIRTRCSAWVKGKNTSILIDAGPEFRIQSIRADLKHIDYVLITHKHMDHVAGIDDLRAYNLVHPEPIPIYSSKECIDSIQKRFDYLFGPNRYPGAASLTLHEIKGPIQLGEFKVTPLPVTHGNLDILGYRINDFCYLTDVKTIPPSTKALMRGAKVVVLSALRWNPEHPTHLTIPEAVEIIEELEIPEAWLIHMNVFVEHQPTNDKLPAHINLSFDEQVLFIDD